MFLSCVSKGILVPNLPLICGYINHVNTKHVSSTCNEVFNSAKSVVPKSTLN